MYEKTDFEEFYFYRDFDPWLPESVTISSVTVKSINKATGADESASMISDAAAYGTPATKARWKIKAGTSGTTYTVKVQVTCSDGQKLESRMEWKVI
jgi:hypothetical protein